MQVSELKVLKTGNLHYMSTTHLVEITCAVLALNCSRFGRKIRLRGTQFHYYGHCGFVPARASSVSSAADNVDGNNFDMIVSHTHFRVRRKINCKSQS